MKKIIRILSFVSICFLVFSAPAHAKRWKIAFLVQEGVPSLADFPVSGFKQGLKVNGFEEGKDYKVLAHKVVAASEEGGAAAAKETQKLLDKGVDMVITLGTAPSVGAWKVLQRSSVPQIYISVTDPVGSGLVESLDKPSGKNITGVRFYVPPEEELKLARRVIPEGKKFGFAYVPDMAEDIARMEQFKNTKNKYGFELKFFDISTEEGRKIYREANDLDAVSAWLGYVVLSQGGLSILAADGVYPIGTATQETLNAYLAAGVVVDTYVVGQQAAVMAIKIMKGESDISEIMPQDSRKWDYMVNMGVARERKLKGVPYEVMVDSDKVVTVLKLPEGYLNKSEEEEE